MKKRVLALVLALALTMGLTSGMVFAADDEDSSDTVSGTFGENLTWVFEDGVLTISGTGEMYDYDYYWNDEELPWYDYSEDITAVVLEDGVTSIGDSAFREYPNLTSISLPEGLTSIGCYAFAYTDLVSIGLPSTLTSIGDSAFSGCTGLTSIEISEGVTSASIGNFAFMDCDSLTSIEIPGGVISIGNCAFMGCDNLTSIEISEGVASIGLGAFMGCDNLTSIEIPASVTSIGYGVFGTFNSEGTSTAKNVIFEGDAPELISGDEYSDNGEQMVLSGDSFKGLFGYAYTYMWDVTYEYSDATIYYYSDAEGFTDEYKALLEECANVTWVVLDRESSESDDSGASLSIIDSATTASYTLGSGSGAVITVDADIETFVSVTVDGTVLTQDVDYTVTEGSTIITFTESFLETLSEGDHDVVIAFTGGDVETILTILAADTSDDADDSEDSDESEAAEVGDSSGLAHWMALGLLAVLGLAGAGLRKRITG